MRVIQPRIVWPDRVLVATEQRQPLLDENLQGQQRLRACQRPRETVQLPGMGREAVVDQRNHLAGHRVRCERRTRRHRAGPGGTEGLAVIGVEIPLTADGFVALHQHTMSPTLLAVEVLHAQGLAPLRMRREFAHADEEVAVLADVQRQTAVVGDSLDRLQHPPVARRGHHQLRRSQSVDVGLQLRRQIAAIVGRIQPRVVQRSTRLLQRQREVAHRREKHHGARFARPHVGRLLRNLGHPHGVAIGVEAIEGRRVEVELVAQHDDQGAQISHPRPSGVGRHRNST